MSTSFKDLGIISPILDALKEMGFEEPTEVQKRAIPHILNNRDIIVMSKTGSGKTAVFGVSMLQMINPEDAGPHGLILTPARELAVQVDNDIRKIAKHLPHRTTAVYGQHNMNSEVQALSNGISIVTGTPGRVYDHICQGTLKTNNIRFLVLDEADRMLDMGFIDQVSKIIKTLPKDRITLLFSATIPPEIKRICSHHMKNPVTVEIESDTKTVDTVKQIYYKVKGTEKLTQLNRLLMAERPENCMIFCNTKVGVDNVQRFLSGKGYACQALHGDIPQARRLKTMQRFKTGGFHIMVATDVAARGIHIESLSLVINYDVPNDKDNYIHRIGRTGRAGHDGKAISLVTVDDIMTLYEIEEHIGALIEESALPADELLNEFKEDIEIWKKANSAKIKPARAVSGSGHGAPRKSSGTRTRAAGNKGKDNYTRENRLKDAKNNTEYSGKHAAKQKVKSVAGDNAGKAANSGQDTNRQVKRGYDKKPNQAGKSAYHTKQSTRRLPESKISQTGKSPSRLPAEASAVHPVADRAKPRPTTTKAYVNTQPVNINNSGNTVQKKEQSLIKRVISRIFGKKQAQD